MTWVAVAVMAALGGTAVGAAVAMGRLGAATAESIARQPEMKRDISMQTLATLGFIESLMLLVWVMAFMVLGKVS
jgi:F0F1-type ATP synthase membrane subunit c/vacuolar-type H+-ATPase subunit K